MSLLRDTLGQLEINISDTQINQFNKYFELLIEYNKVMNLTAITDYDDVIIKHFVDSLLILKVFDFNNVENLLDLGTGAGFPGIPLKIMYPDLKISFLDSLKKRIGFIDTVCNELDLKGYSLLHGRAEDFAHDILYREKFDLVVSRAVAKLSTLSEYCLPYTKVGGTFVSYKSADIENEANSSSTALDILGGQLNSLPFVSIPNTDIVRSFVVIDKINSTPDKYPRKAGKPSKKPL
jgi:16S rRNA (guanine527-N7)-methyltransferase